MSQIKIFRDAAIAFVLSAIAAITFNALRAQGLEFMVFQDYEVFVPCPEPVGEAEPLDASRIRWGYDDELVLDARSPYQYERWHPEGVRNVPFDFLLPVEEDALRKIAQGRSKRVLVYGDGLVPDTGEQLARELNSRGIKNVYYIKGGITAIKQQIGGGRHHAS